VLKTAAAAAAAAGAAQLRANLVVCPRQLPTGLS